MKSIHILLVEDNEGDILLTTEALQESKIVNKVTVLKDGKMAIDFFLPSFNVIIPLYFLSFFESNTSHDDNGPVRCEIAKTFCFK